MKRTEINFQFSAVSDQLSAVSLQQAACIDQRVDVGQPLWGGPHEGRRKAGRAMRGMPINIDFRCGHCGSPVTAAAWLSGVQNRNHCPRCLYSRHLDLHTAGDRLAACKEKMRPIGLAMKQTRKKYAAAARGPWEMGNEHWHSAGELMLAHECLGCGKLSVNRIAADDDAEALMQVFQASLALAASSHQALADGGVRLLRHEDAALVRRRLFGE